MGSSSLRRSTVCNCKCLCAFGVPRAGLEKLRRVSNADYAGTPCCARSAENDKMNLVYARALVQILSQHMPSSSRGAAKVTLNKTLLNLSSNQSCKHVRSVRRTGVTLVVSSPSKDRKKVHHLDCS